MFDRWKILPCRVICSYFMPSRDVLSHRKHCSSDVPCWILLWIRFHYNDSMCYWAELSCGRWCTISDSV